MFTQFNRNLIYMHEFHILVKRKLNKTKNYSLSRSEFLRNITQTADKGAVKVTRKLTAQHGQLIFCEFFMEDNTEQTIQTVFRTLRSNEKSKN